MLKLGWKLMKNLPRMASVAAGAGIAWSALAVDHNMRLGPALPGDRSRVDDGSGGTINLYHDGSGSGTPVLLVHSVNAAASAYEMRPIYTRLRGETPVWALDLPGFGHSDRGDRPYSPRMMALAIGSALDRIGQPAHVVALSLGCEFAARTAVDRSHQFETLSLLSPTGFGPPRQTSAWLAAFLRFPPWSQAVFDGIASRPSIRYFLDKTFAGPVDEMMIDYAYRSSHQPGARYAPIAFLSGELNTPTAVETLYSQVKTPSLVIYDRDPFTTFNRLPEFLAGREGWSASRIAGTRGLPHWDRPTQTMTDLAAHWDSKGG